METMQKFDLHNIFTYHEPTPKQLKQYQRVREAAKQFAKVVIENSPPSADQTVAIRKIREAAMIANAAITLDGKTYINDTQTIRQT